MFESVLISDYVLRYISIMPGKAEMQISLFRQGLSPKKQNKSKSKWNRKILFLALSGQSVRLQQTGIRFQTWWTAWHGVPAITIGPLSSAGSASGSPQWAGRLAMASGGGAASAGYIPARKNILYDHIPSSRHGPVWDSHCMMLLCVKKKKRIYLKDYRSSFQ